MRTFGTSEDRRRLDRLPELICDASGSARANRRELDLSDEESVGLLRLSQEDSEERRERCTRDEEEERVLLGSADACTATEHILCAEALRVAAPSSRIVSMGRLDLVLGLHSLFNRIPDSLISITD